MTTPGDDDQTLAPRRSLSKTAEPSASPPHSQPVAPAPFDGAPQPAPATPREQWTFTSGQPLSSTGAQPPAGLVDQPRPQPGGSTRTSETKARGAARPRSVRRAKLRLLRVDPWSVTKVSFLLSIAFGIMCVVAVFLIFSIMEAAGLWDHVNDTIQGVLNQDPDEAFDINAYVGMDRVMGITLLIAAIDVVLITALATLGTFIYNMAASLLGGVEVTLAEDLK